MKRLAIFMMLLASIVVAQTKTIGTQSNSQFNMPSPLLVDTALTPEVPFTPMAVSMHGYAKRLGDSKESFILRNETHNYRISRVLLKLLYTTADGSLLHAREELVDCDIAPGMTQMVAIKSFDTSKIYYYYTMPPKRASGTPYRIRYDVLRYDIVVE
ncbi:MAG: hypothetical protein J6J06_05810 [Bacteroidaceae bacterium]|nr:hypothetical protein [Bacteroidaceae bacterium]